MSSGPIIVNYAQLQSAFGESVEAVSDGLIGDQLDDLEAAAVAATLQHGLVAIRDAQVVPEVLASPDDRVAAALQSILAENAADLGTPSAVAPGGQEVRFDHFDPRWAKTLIGLLKQKLNIGRFDFRPGPLAGHVLPEQSRIAVLGDWGTSLYGAPYCAESIRADGSFSAVVHLGDVYYSGSAKEIQARFLAEWPFVDGAVNRACNSNHEMFSGGKPYAELTLSRFQQSSSLFWLETSHFVLLGLDTSYDDDRIGTLQAGWLKAVGDYAQQNNKRVVLFSHHQPWQTDDGRPRAHLTRPILGELEGDRIFAWYWGHEHLCALYEPHPKWSLYGACVGHSGFPYNRLDTTDWPKIERIAGVGAWHKLPARHGTPDGLLLDGPNPWIPSHEAEFGPNGYAVLDIDGPSFTETIFTADGKAIHERTLT